MFSHGGNDYFLHNYDFLQQDRQVQSVLSVTSSMFAQFLNGLREDYTDYYCTYHRYALVSKEVHVR